MKKLIFFLLTLTTFSNVCFSQSTPETFLNNTQEKGISIKNAILAKVNGKTLSVIDVMKKMDVIFYKNFPHLSDSKEARYQFYISSWKHVLREIVNSQLILADAESKEIKIEDAEIRKEVDKKFGPNIMLTLDQIGLTYDEAWEMTKEELIVQRMTWFRVNAKAIQSVTPEELKKEYTRYCEENPPKKEWHYETISIRSNTKELSEKIAKNIFSFLQSNSEIETLKKHIEKIEKDETDCKVSLSSEYKVNEVELSKSYKNVLSSLKKNEFSEPVFQLSKNKGSYCYRLFHLKNFKEEIPAVFEALYNKLEDRILQKSVAKESNKYLGKLREFYCYDQQKVELSDNFMPFVLE